MISRLKQNERERNAQEAGDGEDGEDAEDGEEEDESCLHPFAKPIELPADSIRSISEHPLRNVDSPTQTQNQVGCTRTYPSLSRISYRLAVDSRVA